MEVESKGKMSLAMMVEKIGFLPQIQSKMKKGTEKCLGNCISETGVLNIMRK